MTLKGMLVVTKHESRTERSEGFTEGPRVMASRRATLGLLAALTHTLLGGLHKCIACRG